MENEFTPIIEESEIDLIAEMEKATEYKPDSTASTTTDNLDAGAGSSDDFEPAPITDSEEKESIDDNNVNAEDLTELIMSASEMLLESALPALYRTTIAKEDLKVMNELKNIYKQAKENKTKVLTFTERQQEVMEVYLDFDDYCENLPLTTRENKNLRKALKKVLENVNFKASPENALMAVSAMILVPRTLPTAARKFFNKD